MENVYRDNAVFNMSNDEFMRLWFNAWKEDLKSFHFDRYEKEHDEKNNNRNENKNIYKTESPKHKPSTVVKVALRPLSGFLRILSYKWKKEDLEKLKNQASLEKPT